MVKKNDLKLNEKTHKSVLVSFSGILPILKIGLILIFTINVIVTNAQCNFKAIGHRGGSSYYYPENTLVSLEHGFTEGIYAAEVDVRFTADSVLVLMHDSYIDRTTNGTGDVKNLSLAYLKSLDAGSWKNTEYAGTQVPTLYEALQLANEYQKKLYLNMKVFAPDLIAKTLKDGGFPGDIILVDPDDLDKVETYHKILRQTPQVYFGEIPEDIEDAEFYTTLKNNGVVAIEIPADYIYNADDDDFEKLRNMAHSNQIELWAYTVNDPAYFSFLKDFGIDGLETDRPSGAIQVFCDNGSGGYFPEKRITGQWDFESDLTGTIGSQLVLMGDPSDGNQNIKFGSTETFGIPSIENTLVNVARIPAFDPQHALRFFSNIAPEGIPGGLDCDNTYSLIFDILVPSGNNSYTAILQTSNNNSDDADFFILGETNTFGVIEQYNGSFEDSTWVRLALVFDLYKERLDEYLDGEYVATVVLEDSKNGRFCLNNNWGVQSSNFFSDNDGETNPVFVSSIQLRNYSMNAAEIKELGSTKSTKISNSILHDSSLECPEFKNNVEDTIFGNEIILSVSAGDSVNYNWEMDKGWGWENVYGANFINSSSPNLGIFYSDDLIGYKFRCVAFNECKVFSNEYILKDLNTLAKQTDLKDNESLIYPNPSNGKVTISLSNSENPFSIQIYTILGVEVYEKLLVRNRLEISLSEGVYIVHIQNNHQTEVQKLVINN